MELICRLLQQHPLRARHYTDRQGHQQTFNSLGLTLASGSDTLYAELTGDAALRQSQEPPISRDHYLLAKLTARADSFDTQQGDTVNHTGHRQPLGTTARPQ